MTLITANFSKILKVISSAFLIVICWQQQSIAQQKDTILLYNGQILIGDVKGITLETISVDEIDLKMLSVKLYKIRVLKTFHRFKIQTLNKKVYYGYLKSTDKYGWVEIVSDDGNVIPIPLTDIYFLVLMEKSVFNRMNGAISAGFSYAKSSNIGQLTLSANVKLPARLFNHELAASEIASIDSGKLSRDNENVEYFVSYDLSASWFLAADLQYQRNLELSISRRFLEMIGAGNKLVIKSTWQLLAITGLTFTQEKSTENISRGTLLEVPFMFRFEFYKFRHPDIQMSSSQTGYFGITEAGRIRYSGSTTFSWQLVRYFYLTINPYTNFDSQPPSSASSKFDFGIVVGISYKF